MQKIIQGLLSGMRRIVAVAVIVLMVITFLAPMIYRNKTYAAGQLTQRSVSISTAVPSAASTWTLSFQIATANPVQSMKIEVCTVALGTCSSPGSLLTGATYGGISNWTNSTAFNSNVGSNDCTASATVFCITRAQPANELTGATKTLTINASNPATVNTTWFVKLTTYSDAVFTAANIVDAGSVAASTSQTLTVNASVQEVLAFCIGATAIDDAITSVGANCAAIAGSSVNLGTLDSTLVNVTPVLGAIGGSNTNGVAMLKTNAINGASVNYKAVQAVTGTNHLGTLRVPGANCNAGNVNTDQCIDAQGGTQATFSAGTEKFGMTIAGTNCASVQPASYSCVLASGTNKLKAVTNYIGATAITYGSSAGFAWVEGGSATQVASSTTIVDNEALMLKFAATPSITTPPGVYSAQADFIAVATY